MPKRKKREKDELLGMSGTANPTDKTAWYPGSVFGYVERRGRVEQRTEEEAKGCVARGMKAMSEEEKYAAWVNYLHRMLEEWEQGEYGINGYDTSEVCPETEREATLQLVEWMEQHMNTRLDSLEK